MAIVYLIPSLLSEEGVPSIPHYVHDAIKECGIFFVENERTTRRYFKQLWKQMNIDEYEWHVISKESVPLFRQKLKGPKHIGIVSEAGCPGVADPGQELVAIAHQENVTVKPLVGPNSILLALMGSGMNGQHFQFHGYLPIETQDRIEAITKLEVESRKKKCTQIFIETPYRNNQLLTALLKTCSAQTNLCVAVGITSINEWIKTKKIEEWRSVVPDIHKKPAIFLLYAGD